MDAAITTLASDVASLSLAFVFFGLWVRAEYRRRADRRLHLERMRGLRREIDLARHLDDPRVVERVLNTFAKRVSAEPADHDNGRDSGPE